MSRYCKFLLFLTALMLCALISYVSDWTYSLMSTPNYRFLRNFSWKFYLRCESFFYKSVERKSLFCSGCLTCGLKPNNPAHYLWEYGDCCSKLTLNCIPHLQTRLTELLLSHSPALPCILYGKVNSLINVVEGVRYS